MDNLLSERQAKILYSLIQEHIKTAKPIASAALVKKNKFGFSPATIRNEFAELENMGFLEQPYTSSGRVPTSKAYRYFVDNIVEGIQRERHRLDDLEAAIRSSIGSDHFNRHLVKSLADASNNMALGWTDDDNDDFYFSGFKNLLREPELEGEGYYTKIGDILDRIDDDIEKFVENEEERGKDVKVFIGSEVPIRGAKDFSLIISSVPYKFGNLKIAIFGPQRMDYEKNLQLIAGIKKLLE